MAVGGLDGDVAVGLQQGQIYFADVVATCIAHRLGKISLAHQLALQHFLQHMAMPRQYHRLAFDHPASGERIELAAPLPPDCVTLLNRLPPLPAAAPSTDTPATP